MMVMKRMGCICEGTMRAKQSRAPARLQGSALKNEQPSSRSEARRYATSEPFPANIDQHRSHVYDTSYSAERGQMPTSNRTDGIARRESFRFADDLEENIVLPSLEMPSHTSEYMQDAC